VTESDLPELAAGQESGLAKIIGLNILVFEARFKSAGFQDCSRGFRGVDLREQPFDLALREDFAFWTVWTVWAGAAHGVSQVYCIANSVK
jgi:hypothetical protein